MGELLKETATTCEGSSATAKLSRFYSYSWEAKKKYLKIPGDRARNGLKVIRQQSCSAAVLREAGIPWDTEIPSSGQKTSPPGEATAALPVAAVGWFSCREWPLQATQLRAAKQLMHLKIPHNLRLSSNRRLGTFVTIFRHRFLGYRLQF